MTPAIAGRQVWSAKLDSVRFPLSVVSRDGQFVVAGSDGTVMGLEAQTGRTLWRASAGGELSAGVGSDGRFHAVVTTDNRLVTSRRAREAWRTQLNCASARPPRWPASGSS